MIYPKQPINSYHLAKNITNAHVQAPQHTSRKKTPASQPPLQASHLPRDTRSAPSPTPSSDNHKLNSRAWRWRHASPFYHRETLSPPPPPTSPPQPSSPNCPRCCHRAAARMASRGVQAVTVAAVPSLDEEAWGTGQRVEQGESEACGPERARAMEANMPKRKEPGKSLRIKVISMGNAEVGKVSTELVGAGPHCGGATCRLARRAVTQQPGAQPLPRPWEGPDLPLGDGAPQGKLSWPNWPLGCHLSHWRHFS